MAGINIDQLEQGKELSNYGKRLIRHVFALCASDEESGLPKAHVIWVLVREIAEKVEGFA